MKATRVTSRLLLVLLAATAVVPLWVSPAQAACDKFEVGSERWQKCVQREASGGGGGQDNSGGGGQNDNTDPGADENDTGPGSDVACSEFQVGTTEWTDCIKGAATGGGLMPWIVIGPLGLMLAGMAVMFWMQARRRRKVMSGASVGSMAGGWLIFMAFIMGVMGAGSLIAESRADGPFGGFGIAAYVQLGVAVLMLLAGIAVTVSSRKKLHIAETGVAGEGRILSLGQTGTYINQNPVFEFSLEVTIPGRAPYQAYSKTTVPMYLVQKVSPGTTLAVKVDPSKPDDVVIDWAPMASVAPSSLAGMMQPPTPGGPGLS